MIESVTCYGCGIWLLKRVEQRKILALEMDYLRRSNYKKSQKPKLENYKQMQEENQF
jgi:hypothetical protein